MSKTIMTPDVTYKLPRPFLDVMRENLSTIDWADISEPVRMTLPDGTVVMLEVIKSQGVIVRPHKAGDANRIRKFADQLTAANPEKYPQATSESIELIIKARNPAPDQQD